MNLLCPACQKMITVPDQYAGQTMKCPLCSQLFPARCCHRRIPSRRPSSRRLRVPGPRRPWPSRPWNRLLPKESGFVFFQGRHLYFRFAAGADAALPSARGGDFRAS